MAAPISKLQIGMIVSAIAVMSGAMNIAKAKGPATWTFDMICIIGGTIGCIVCLIFMIKNKK